MSKHNRPPQSTTNDLSTLSRRGAIYAIIAASCSVWSRPVFSSGLALTPAQTEGPYYPIDKPLNPGADLTIVRGQRAQGQRLALTGQIFKPTREPYRDIRVEIWQCDANGIYRHPRAPSTSKADPGFAGYGETQCDTGGHYAFTTIMPVAYPGRPPHIHVKLKSAGRTLLTTQIYLDEARERAVISRLRRWFTRTPDALRMQISQDKIAGQAALNAQFNFVV